MLCAKGRSLCVGLLVVAGVWGSAGPAPAQTTLRYKFKEGETLPYVMEQKMDMTMNIAGKDVKVSTAQTIDLDWHVTAVDKDGKAKLKQTITRIRMVMEGIPDKVTYDSKEGKDPEGPFGKMVVPVFKAMAGAEFTLTMDPQGRLSDVQVPQKVLEAMKNLPGGGAAVAGLFSEDNLKQMVNQGGLQLPAGPVTQGMTWDQKVEAKMPFGTMKVDNQCAYQGEVMRDGKKLAEIIMKPKLVLEPSDKAPAKIQLKEQEGKGAAYFDPEAGRLAETNLQQSMTMEISAGGQSITQKMVQSITMKLQGGKKE